VISFRKNDTQIIATYSTRSENIDWLYKKLENGEKYAFQKTFTFSKSDLLEDLPDRTNEFNSFDGPEPIDFLFASLKDEYYQVKKGVLTYSFEVFISKEIDVSIDLFVAESDISIYRKMEGVISEDIYIGGSNPKAIQQATFIDLIRQFPNAYEKNLYSEAKVSSLVKEFFSSTKDIEKRFQKYLNKKQSVIGENLLKTFQETEVIKYTTIYEKLLSMLSRENSYSETQWQKEILQIILLLYPKYIFVLTEVPINADDVKEKYLDFLLVDANGHVDIIEIKKPFDNSIVTSGLYRDNHIPLRELSGTVMQIEKYIYYLNRWSIRGEKYLTEKYENKLPKGFEISITNPSAFIIMGREKDLTTAQKRDFEVVKRKYKNVVDIITYDNLLDRLNFTIEQIKKV
jgi:hypothetical protein